jgi:hypothetical protein
VGGWASEPEGMGWRNSPLPELDPLTVINRRWNSLQGRNEIHLSLLYSAEIKNDEAIFPHPLRALVAWTRKILVSKYGMWESG